MSIIPAFSSLPRPESRIPAVKSCDAQPGVSCSGPPGLRSPSDLPPGQKAEAQGWAALAPSASVTFFFLVSFGGDAEVGIEPARRGVWGEAPETRCPRCSRGWFGPRGARPRALPAFTPPNTSQRLGGTERGAGAAWGRFGGDWGWGRMSFMYLCLKSEPGGGGVGEGWGGKKRCFPLVGDAPCWVIAPCLPGQ